jgi:hypothetical protein
MGPMGFQVNAIWKKMNLIALRNQGQLLLVELGQRKTSTFHLPQHPRRPEREWVLVDKN